MKTLSGFAHVYGDHIDTDAIIAGKYTKTLDRNIFAQHVLEDLDPLFRQTVKPGDIMVAGDNFGCGSSREQAPLALKAAGVSAVIARYFARIFYRNAINIGLPVFEIADFEIQTGDELSIDLSSGMITNCSSNRTYQSAGMPPIMVAILQAGGLVEYLRKNKNYTLA